MKLKEIHRTSTFTWSPSSSLPLIATGTVAGALDESFSNESQLEIWAPDFLDRNEFDLGIEGHSGPKGAVKNTARFNRLAWGYVDSSRPQGIIAAGMENGELALWDPEKILAGASSSESLILRNNNHTGPVRALDFNPLHTHLFSSGAVNGEVWIWDLKDPTKPYAPTSGSRSTKLDKITSIAWNQQVPYVLAGASTTGYTVVWDLRGKREVVALAYGGGAGTLAGQVSATSGLAVGGRSGMSAIAWHPDDASRLVTASEDDSFPMIMVWDLRNARAPEMIATGHDKGVLSLSWCKQDADMLLSCGKDNRVLCWNPQTSEIIGELPSVSKSAFDVKWCPRNPDLLAIACFDGTVGIHSIQSFNEPAVVTAVLSLQTEFLPPGTPPSIVDLVKRAELAEPGACLEIELDDETSVWLDDNYEVVSSIRVGKFEVFDNKAVIRVATTFMHEAITRVVQSTISSRADSEEYQQGAAHVRLHGGGGGYKVPDWQLRRVSHEEKKTDEERGKGKKRKPTDDDGDDLVVPQPIVVFESAFGEGIKKLRFDLLRLCLGMGSVGAWGIGFKIRGKTRLTGIQVLMCVCTCSKELRDQSDELGQDGEIYASKGERGKWTLLEKEDPEHFSRFCLPRPMKEGGYRYFECEFSEEWTIKEDDKDENADISIHIIGSDEPLVIKARKLWETLIPAFQSHVADQKQGNAMPEAHTGPSIRIGDEVFGDLHRRKKMKDN
ncbi:WD40-repeat-containing domain protein [Armillaria novae-zelandiae]|uniref:Protein transport protein SEC31 n=1 Tax=Armillaria novae-zelandiae TaxID=153914 RepID=A0AA39NL38_9AGAR|nr:WD40-repeat-containing domain protein [Armillaria novae-zelandiae]